MNQKDYEAMLRISKDIEAVFLQRLYRNADKDFSMFYLYFQITKIKRDADRLITKYFKEQTGE